VESSAISQQYTDSGLLAESVTLIDSEAGFDAWRIPGRQVNERPAPLDQQWVEPFRLPPKLYIRKPARPVVHSSHFEGFPFNLTVFVTVS
jgi:hypothetical protein